MTPPRNGETARKRDRRSSDATYHRERPLAHPHLLVCETTEARQQGAGRHLHEGGCHGKGLCGGQPDRRGNGDGHGVHQHRQGSQARRCPRSRESNWSRRRLLPLPSRRPHLLRRARFDLGKVPVLPSAKHERPPLLRKRSRREPPAATAPAGAPSAVSPVAPPPETEPKSAAEIERERGVGEEARARAQKGKGTRGKTGSGNGKRSGRRRRHQGPREGKGAGRGAQAGDRARARCPPRSGRRCGRSRPSPPRRSPTSSSPATRSAPARPVRSPFPSIFANTNKSGSRRRRRRGRPARARRWSLFRRCPVKCRLPAASVRGTALVRSCRPWKKKGP